MEENNNKNSIMSKSASLEVGNLSNEQLKSLLKEIHKISIADKPAKVSQSETMKFLFEVENNKNNYWFDNYQNVKQAIQSEILYRVRKNMF